MDAMRNGGPLRPKLSVQRLQGGILMRLPGITLDAGVQVTSPASHALLVSAAVQAATDLCPAVAKLLHQPQQAAVFIISPFLLADVGIDLRTDKLSAAA